MPAKLLLLDSHPAVPFLVRSHQFLSRYAAFGDVLAGSGVGIVLPGPAAAADALRAQIGLPLAEPPVFGPDRHLSVLGAHLTLTGRFRRFLRHLLAREAAAGPVVAYLRTLKLAHSLRPTLRRHGIPFLFETHEIFHHGAKDPAATRRIEAEVYRAAALVLPISAPLRDDLVREFDLAPGPVIPSGHNGSLATLPPYDPAAPPRFLYVGSLHSWKGLEPFLLGTRDLGLPTDIAGDAGGLDRLRDFVRSHRLDHVTLHGQVPPAEVARLYTPGTICVLPLSEAAIAQRYTSPLKLFEYASAGRPVMIGDCPSIRSIPGIADAVCFVGTSPGAWRDQTRRLLDDPGRRTTIATRARPFAARFTWSAIARRLVADPSFAPLLAS